MNKLLKTLAAVCSFATLVSCSTNKETGESMYQISNDEGISILQDIVNNTQSLDDVELKNLSLDLNYHLVELSPEMETTVYDVCFFANPTLSTAYIYINGYRQSGFSFITEEIWVGNKNNVAFNVSISDGEIDTYDVQEYGSTQEAYQATTSSFAFIVLILFFVSPYITPSIFQNLVIDVYKEAMSAGPQERFNETNPIELNELYFETNGHYGCLNFRFDCTHDDHHYIIKAEIEDYKTKFIGQYSDGQSQEASVRDERASYPQYPDAPIEEEEE